jgi:hypothetical protein
MLMGVLFFAYFYNPPDTGSVTASASEVYGRKFLFLPVYITARGPIVLWIVLGISCKRLQLSDLADIWTIPFGYHIDSEG